MAGERSQEILNQATNTPPTLTQPAAPGVAAPVPTAAGAAQADPTAEEGVVDAPAQPITTTKPLPPGVKPSAPVAEVIKLVDSGVEESVMLAFVTNSPSTFNLGADEIIYLNDIGVPSAVLTAMIQRDQELKTLYANAVPAPAPPDPAVPEAPVTEPEPEPAPADMAPQPDYAAAEYPPATEAEYAPFYDSLAPYGTWVDVSGYGPCWQPTVVIVNPGWRPYCDSGRWVYTDYGWYWLSGYSWGWAPFHYGRWFRHNHYGWCWAPGSTWGPSWVSWRYNGNYCGWAPLPPAAVYHPAVGLTYHGQHVHSGFTFGLGVGAFTFVQTGHFCDPHPSHHALPRHHATQIYNQTTPSVTVVGNSSRVVNRGIPVSRVENATRTQIHRVGIREVNTPANRGARGDRLEPNGRTLSVFRPQFQRSSGAQSAFGGGSRSDIRQGRAGTVATPTHTSSRATPAPPSRSSGGGPATRPNSGGGSGRRPDRSAIQANDAPTTTTDSAPTLAHLPSDPPVRAGEPLILHGSQLSRASMAEGGASTPNQATPSSSLIIIGRRDDGRRQADSPSSTPAIQVQPSRPAEPRQDAISRPAATPNPRPIMTAEANVQAPSQPRWSAPRAIEQPARAERPRQAAAPAYQAPVNTPRSSPAPSYTPPRAPSYSPPAAAPALRPQPSMSQPARSAPSAPPASAPAAPSRPSTGRGGR